MDKNVEKKAIAGVSIVEIMISLVLVALALIAITTVFPNILGHRKGIHEAEQAKIIADEAIEYLQYYDCVDVNSGPGNNDFTAKYGSLGALIPIPMGAVEYTVEKRTASCVGDIYTVDVEVKWRKGGKNHTVKTTGALR